MTKFTISQFNELIDNPSASMGYPIYFICADGGILSVDAAREQRDRIVDAISDEGSNRQWEVIGCEINYENTDMYCDHTGKLIPAAYE